MGLCVRMTLGKHILVLVAFMFFMMPGMHAAAHHDDHDHGHAAGTELCGLPVHTCACHSCESIPCEDEVQVPQETILGSSIVAAPAYSFILFTFSEKRPAPQRAPSTVSGTLAALQTVQLLI